MRYDFISMLPDMAFQPRGGRGPFARGMTLEGGKGGGGPGTTKTETSNIPEYARPYVENMMNATQRQLFTMSPGQAGQPAKYDAEGNMISPEVAATGEQITGFKPYQAYSTNVNDYVADFSPLQKQSFQGMANMQVAPQIGQASQMAGLAGAGSFGLGTQAAGTGANYAQMATDPNAIRAYMSPYMQNVVDYQKSQALRDFQIGQPMMQAKAAGQGAFGGNRLALQQAEAQRGLMSQLQGIEAQGAQQAFGQAQQAQQFGANLGLQGLQTGLQGYGQAGQAASTLGQLGQSQYGQQMGILEGQNKFGAQIQQQEQQKINQAIQDWANTQQYPLMQLGVMSNMLRGLPMQGVTTNQYVPQANSLSQGIGTAGALASLYNATKAEGGVVKSMASGGIASIPRYDVGGEIESKLYEMSPEDLARYKDQTTSPTIKRLAERILREETGKAGGGIIAFANPNEENNQGLVKEDPEAVRRAYIEAAREQAGNPPVLETSEPYKPSDKHVPLTERLGKAIGIKDAGRQVPTKETTTMPVRPDGSDVPYVAGEKPAVAPAATSSGIKAAQRIDSDVPTVVSAPAKAATPAAELPPMPTNVKKDELGRADAAKQGPSAGIKATPSTGVGIKPNTGIVPNIGGIKGPTGPTGLEMPVDPDANKTIAQLAADKEAYMGPNKGAQEDRARLMSERANAADEARRTQSMRMAEFFAAWGSTPGNTIVAGLNALKNKVPDFISDTKEATKIRRAIDKDIAELDKIERLEKAGNYDEAAKRKNDLSKNAINVWGKKVDYLSARESDASRERAAAISASGRGGESKDLEKLIGRRTAIDGEITKFKDKNDRLVRQANRPNPNNDPALQKSIDAAKSRLEKELKPLQDQLNEVDALIKSSKRIQAVTGGEGSGSTEKVRTYNRETGKIE